MHTRYGQSPWIATRPASRRQAYPRLKGEHAASIVIIGGGLTGCATAYACAAAGLKALLVDAARVGEAGAGHSAGLLLPDPGADLRDLAALHGLRAARHAFDAWRRASLEAAALLRRILGVRARLDPLDSLRVARPGAERSLRREYEARKAAGVAASWLSAGQTRQLTALESGPALRLHDAFGLDPYRACLALAAAAARRGAVLFEQSPVRRVRVRAGSVEIGFEGATIEADRVVVTTGTPIAAFKPLQRHFTPRETYLVLTEPMPAGMRRSAAHPGLTLCDTATPRHRVRWLRDHRVLVAGADQDPPAGGRDATLVQRTGQLMYELLTMYPAISGLRPAFGWSLSSGVTADGLPYIGPHRNYPRHLFALGVGGDSVTGAFLAARILIRALRGEPDRADGVFGFTR